MFKKALLVTAIVAVLGIVAGATTASADWTGEVYNTPNCNWQVEVPHLCPYPQYDSRPYAVTLRNRDSIKCRQVDLWVREYPSGNMRWLGTQYTCPGNVYTYPINPPTMISELHVTYDHANRHFSYIAQVWVKVIDWDCQVHYVKCADIHHD